MWAIYRSQLKTRCPEARRPFPPNRTRARTSPIRPARCGALAAVTENAFISERADDRVVMAHSNWMQLFDLEGNVIVEELEFPDEGYGEDQLVSFGPGVAYVESGYYQTFSESGIALHPFDLSDGTPLEPIRIALDESVEHAIYSNGAAWIIGARRLHRFDIGTGTLQTFISDENLFGTDVFEVTADGSFLVAGGRRMVHVFETASFMDGPVWSYAFDSIAHVLADGTGLIIDQPGDHRVREWRFDSLDRPVARYVIPGRASVAVRSSLTDGTRFLAFNGGEVYEFERGTSTPVEVYPIGFYGSDNGEINAVAFLPDADAMLVHVDLVHGPEQLRHVPFTPRILRSSHSFYDGSSDRELWLFGSGLTTTTTVLIGGQPAAFRVVRPGTIAVTPPGPHRGRGVKIVASNSYGSGAAFAMRNGLPVGYTTAELRYFGYSGADGWHPTPRVGCRNEYGQSDDLLHPGVFGTTVTVAVQAFGECNAFAGVPEDDTEHTVSGYWSPTTDQRSADIDTFSFDFRSYRPTTAYFQRRDQPPKAYERWIFTSGFGSTPPGAVYRVTVSCPSFTNQSHELTPGFGFRLDADHAQQGIECRLDVPDAAGGAVLGYFGVREGTRYALENQSFTIGSNFEYFLVYIDHGGSDIHRPIAVGAPGEWAFGQAGSGAVHVFATTTNGLPDNANSQLLAQGVGTVAGVTEAGDRFGEALTTGDFDADGWLDIGIGVPGEDLRAAPDAGAVIVVYGSADGYTSGRSQIFHARSRGVKGPASAGDEFGYAVAAVDFDGDGFDDLAIGAPGKDLDEVNDAGVVHVLFGSQDGLSGAGAIAYSQETKRVPGVSKSGDRFGSALDGADSWLLIGVPGDDAAGPVDSGSAYLLSWPHRRKRLIHPGRNARGVPAAQDRFGSAVAVTPWMMAIGVPLRDSKGLTDAGAVFHGPIWTGRELWEEDQSRLWPNVARAGERFGASLDGVGAGGGPGVMVIGAPGEFAGYPGAGMVHLVRWNESGILALANWTQSGQLMAGVSEAGDGFGTEVTLSRYGAVLVGVEHEDIGAARDAGTLWAVTGGPLSVELSQNSPGVPSAATSNDRVGAAVAS